MSSPISSVLATLDGNLQSIASQVGRLRASLELDDEQLKRMLTDARRDAAKVRDLIRAERPDAQWKDRGALDSLIRDLEVAAEQKRIQERRNKLLDLASELDRGKVKHRVEARTATLNGLRLEAVKQLRKDAELAQQDKQLPGPPAREWLHWACNLQEQEDAQSLETLRTKFPALEHFVGEMEESYWVAGEAGAAIASQPSAPAAPMTKAAAAETVAFPTPKPIVPPRVADQDKVPHIVRPQPAAPSPAPATAAAYQETTAPSRAVAQSPRRSENKTGWQAAAVAVAREPEPEAPPTAPSKKHCDKCGTDYPVQFIVCPIHGSALRVVQETVAAPATRDKSAVAATAAVAVEPKPTATKAARASAPTPVSESPKQAKVEAPVVEKVSKPARTEIETIAVVDEASAAAADGELSGLAHWTAQAKKLLATPAVLAGVGLLLFVVLVAGVILLISHQRPKPVAPKPVAVAPPTVAPLTEVNVAANQPAGTTTTPSTTANTKTAADQSKPQDQTAETKPRDTQPTTVLNLPSPSRNPAPKQEDTSEAPSIAAAMPNANTMGEIVKGIPVSLPTQNTRVTSGVAQGQLVKQVPPQYPQQARQLRVEGPVVLQATISKDGTVKSVKVISGHTLLTKAAVDAVKQWHYKPFTVDGQPVEADTQVKVNFTLGTP